MYRGMTARIKFVNPKSARLFKVVTRPIIIASDVEQNINNQQISIEINQFRPVEHAEILGPLLDVMVKVIGQPICYPKPLAMAMPHVIQQSITPQYVNTS